MRLRNKVKQYQKTINIYIDFQHEESGHQHTSGFTITIINSEKIEPHLGFKQPTVVIDYPVEQAALAHCIEGKNAVAEEF